MPPVAVRRLLVVDDNEQILHLIERLLARVGFDVSTAVSPLDAIAWCENNGLPDLLISDVRMPVMSGPQLYETLRDSFGEVPVLFISGDTGGSWHKPELQILDKPFSRSQLIEAIATFFPDQPQPATD